MLQFLLLILALVSPPIYAEGDTEKEKGPCREDVKKFCGEIKPGGGAIVKCMKEHESQKREH
jgi:hypothetical protein